MTLDSVVCFKWKPVLGYRSSYGPDQVNVFFSMTRRHYRPDVRCICVTDDAKGIDASIEIVPMWDTFASVPSPHGGKNPACYRRLKAFSAEAGDWFGQRFVCVDLDTVICGDMAPVWDRDEDFVIWGETDPRSNYNGSMFLMTAGARRQVYEQFNPAKSPREHFRAGKFGSDQGWISHLLGKGEKCWSTKDGVYSYRKHIATKGNVLPENARIVMWHGRHDPWDYKSQNIPWVKEHYRMQEVAA